MVPPEPLLEPWRYQWDQWGRGTGGVRQPRRTGRSRLDLARFWFTPTVHNLRLPENPIARYNGAGGNSRG